MINLLIVVVSLVLIFSKSYQTRYIIQPINDLSNRYSVTQNLLHNYKNKPSVIYFSGLHHNLMITSLRIFQDKKLK